MPAPAAISSNRSKPSSARCSRRVSGGVEIGVEGPETSATPRPCRCRDTSQLGEERDHVEQKNQIELTLAEGESRGVSDLEAHPVSKLRRKEAAGLLDHGGREVDPDHLGLPEALGDEPRALSRAGSQVEDALGRGLEAVERRR